MPAGSLSSAHTHTSSAHEGFESDKGHTSAASRDNRPSIVSSREHRFQLCACINIPSGVPASPNSANLLESAPTECAVHASAAWRSFSGDGERVLGLAAGKLWFDGQ